MVQPIDHASQAKYIFVMGAKAKMSDNRFGEADKKLKKYEIAVVEEAEKQLKEYENAVGDNYTNAVTTKVWAPYHITPEQFGSLMHKAKTRSIKIIHKAGNSLRFELLENRDRDARDGVWEFSK